MWEAGAARAVMGNHEFNAIGWAAQNKNGTFLRSHSEKNASQHAKFLRQIEEDSAHHKDAASWFRNLPIWLDLPGLRVVIARAIAASAVSLPVRTKRFARNTARQVPQSGGDERGALRASPVFLQ